MSDYPHLKLPFRVAGLVKPQGFKNKPNPNTIKFKNQRQSHGEYLMNSASSIFNHWVNLKKAMRQLLRLKEEMKSYTLILCFKIKANKNGNIFKTY